MTARVSTPKVLRLASAILVAFAVAIGSAQTKIVAPKNKYKPAEDVKLGQEAAAEARKELPLFVDERVDPYVDEVGTRLVAAIPSEYQHQEFKYTFDVINQKEINAFALPGGPMFLNRGMISSAKTEAEMAGVMAHEISHVALRHGTAQVSKSFWPSIVGAAGQIGGAIIGGVGGDLATLGSQIGATAWATKYSREYETQADILGAQILARAGYEPREMANMFKTIEAEGGSGGITWLSSHPNPSNRYARITQEAEALKVQGSADTSRFASIQARLKEAGPAYSAEQIAKGQHKTGNTPKGGTARTVRVEPPSNKWQTQSPADFLQVAVPANWHRVEGKGGATYAPQGAVFESENGRAFTHGVQFGTTKGSGNLQRDTEALLGGFARTNPQLRQRTALANDSLSGRRALSTTLSNVSDVTGQEEVVALTTTSLPDGNLLFLIGVAPRAEASAYGNAFRRVKESVKIANQ
jgi:hypothetical protein